MLLSCLQECAEGRWGLFNPRYRYFEWPKAEELTRNAYEIQSMKAQFGHSNQLCERFLHYCEMRGAQVLGEPKLARQFLEEISTLEERSQSPRCYNQLLLSSQFFSCLSA